MHTPESRALLTRIRTALHELEGLIPVVRDGIETLASRTAGMQEDLATLYTLLKRDEAAYPELAALLTTVADLEHASDGLDTALVAGARADVDALETDVAEAEES
jgi:hypothetical protein